MTSFEQAAFQAGVHHAAEVARIAAIKLDIRSDAAGMRHRAAIAALFALADGLKGKAPEAARTLAQLEGARFLPARANDVHIADTFPKAGQTPLRDQSLACGYTADPCPTCANFTLRRAGTCLACDTCGSTTGCS